MARAIVTTFLLVPWAYCAGTSHAASSAGLSVPLPKDLCKSPQQRRIRARIKAASKRAGVKVLGEEGLVPCKHGAVQYLRFQLLRRDIVVIAEEDFRPSYISGGTHKRHYALVDKTVVYGFDALWKTVRNPRKLRDMDLVNLLVAAALFRAQPVPILDHKRRKAVVSKWPDADRAFSRDPPGLQLKNGRFSLQAWEVHSYSERGVLCRYINGWRLTINRATGLTAVHNHKYAAGRNMGRPCGKPLPGTSSKP